MDPAELEMETVVVDPAVTEADPEPAATIPTAPAVALTQADPELETVVVENYPRVASPRMPIPLSPELSGIDQFRGIPSHRRTAEAQAEAEA